MIATRDHTKASAGASVDVGEPPDVLLSINQHVIGLRCAQSVAIDSQGSMIFVEPDVVKCACVRIPYNRSLGLLDQIGCILSVRPGANADCKVL